MYVCMYVFMYIILSALMVNNLLKVYSQARFASNAPVGLDSRHVHSKRQLHASNIELISLIELYNILGLM